ncbi:MAG: NADH-quinone oxidoreductase subunit L [Acidobacteriia bacterium]|nr:NADH-quinone oxidoreductase subunit L [Terriglobia bacterium]
MNFFELIWLIPFLPAMGALINGLCGRMFPRWIINLIACGVVGVAFLISLGAFFQLINLSPDNRVFETNLFTWILAGNGELTSGQIAPFNVEWGYQLDPLSAVMILVVTGIGFLIHLYSIGYMAHEEGYYRFFTYLNLFMFSMLTLVLANNFVLMFVGWEGVGLCSYLLIGFYFHKKSAADAGKKAFVVNRIGDFGFILGIFLIFTTFGSFDFTEVFGSIDNNVKAGVFQSGDLVFTVICLLLFVGAAGKSAQVPLYVWLPDAMEGPTPVSALIHAATMVTAGVYMVARSNLLFALSPTALFVVAFVGAFTAIYAASIGLVQNDIKRVLAYSTVSQLGYMFLACGVAAFGAAVFHLMTHAFFKALLFLGAGSVIHAVSGEQDMRKMGGLRRRIPITFWTMMAGTIAIAGFPPFAGFFSKDEILWKAISSPYGHFLFWFVGILAAGLTAFYMFRMMFLTFYGKTRTSKEIESHIHESPATMTMPLVILAIGAIGAGWIGIPHVIGQYLFHLENYFEHFLAPVFENSIALQASHGSESLEWGLMILSIAIATGGLLFARHLYITNPTLPEKLSIQFKHTYTTLLNKYWIDEIYDLLFVNRTKGLGTKLGSFDQRIVDGLVNGSAWLTRALASLSGFFDHWFVDFAVRRSDLIYYLSFPLRRIQTGVIQNYMALAIAGILVIIGYFAIN